MISFKYTILNTVKTQACKQAIPISSKIITKIIVIENKFKNQVSKLAETIANIKETNILSKICPANMFANSRIDKLKILEI